MTTSSGRSVQIRYIRRRILSLLICIVVNCYFIRYGDIAVQSACTISRPVRANDLGNRTYNHWRELSGKPCKRYISVTDEVKIKEQFKSIATGSFTEFERCKTPKWILEYSNDVVCCVKNRNPIAKYFSTYIDLISMLYIPQDHFLVEHSIYAFFPSR